MTNSDMLRSHATPIIEKKMPNILANLLSECPQDKLLVNLLRGNPTTKSEALLHVDCRYGNF